MVGFKDSAQLTNTRTKKGSDATYSYVQGSCGTLWAPGHRQCRLPGWPPNPSACSRPSNDARRHLRPPRFAGHFRRSSSPPRTHRTKTLRVKHTENITERTWGDCSGKNIVQGAWLKRYWQPQNTTVKRRSPTPNAVEPRSPSPLAAMPRVVPSELWPSEDVTPLNDWRYHYGGWKGCA